MYSVLHSECFYKEMYFHFFKKFPFPGKVFLTNVCEADSKQGGWVAQLQGPAFTVSSR